MTDPKPPRQLEHIGGIIKSALEKWTGSVGEPITRVWAVWDAAVGDQIAANARPAYLKHETLFVHVTSSVWVQQLQFSKKSLIEKVNQAAGCPLFTDIKFKVKP